MHELQAGRGQTLDLCSVDEAKEESGGIRADEVL
jgi:hypothetical protein